jgi:hypothetical protein
MPARRLEQVDGSAAGGWILPALRDGFGGHVKQQVPQIYAAYARILHPAFDEQHEEVTWAEVTRRLGTIAHRGMQWHAIVGSWDPSNFRDSRWAGGDPSIGELQEDKLDELCALLASHTATAASVYFGMSTIRSGVEEEWPDAPLLAQPARTWVVLHGPLTAVDQIMLGNRHGFVIYAYPEGEEPPPGYEPPERFRREVPNLIWPEDRAWFVASEYDLDSTLVGGTRALIDAILAAPGLEAWEVDGEVSLQSDADKLNPVPDRPPFVEDRGDGPGFFWLAGNILETLSGAVTAAAINQDGALQIEVTPAGRPPWHLRADRAEWSPADPSALLGATVESVQIDADSGALRCDLGAAGTLEIAPSSDAADDDHPAWRVDLANDTAITLGSELRLIHPTR